MIKIFISEATGKMLLVNKNYLLQNSFKRIRTSSTLLIFGKGKNDSSIYGKGKNEKTEKSAENTPANLTKAQLIKVEEFFSHPRRDKTAFLTNVKTYIEREKNLKGHVDFINGALSLMEEYGVHKDLESYKALFETIEKDKFVPTSFTQIIFMHYPAQQIVATRILEQMNHFDVMPDLDLEAIVMERFGIDSMPGRKLARMNYWMAKIKYASPWLLPDVLPNDGFKLGLLAMKQMATVDPTIDISIFKTEDFLYNVKNTWGISALCRKQKELIGKLKKGEALKIEGPIRIYLKDVEVLYFVLNGNPIPYPPYTESDYDDVSDMYNWYRESRRPKCKILTKRSIHEEDDKTIYSMCITGNSTNDSLLAWIKFLELECPKLKEVPILFTIPAAEKEVMEFKKEKKEDDSL